MREARASSLRRGLLRSCGLVGRSAALPSLTRVLVVATEVAVERAFLALIHVQNTDAKPLTIHEFNSDVTTWVSAKFDIC